MKLEKTDSGYFLPIPEDVAAALDLREGDEVELLKLTPPTDPADAGHALGMRVIRRFRGTVPADFRFDRDEANAR